MEFKRIISIFKSQISKPHLLKLSKYHKINKIVKSKALVIKISKT